MNRGGSPLLAERLQLGRSGDQRQSGRLREEFGWIWTPEVVEIELAAVACRQPLVDTVQRRRSASAPTRNPHGESRAEARDDYLRPTVKFTLPLSGNVVPAAGL